MKCHWCQKDILVVNKNEPSYLECPDVHALIQLNPHHWIHDSVFEAITVYTLYHDVGDIRYRMVGNLAENKTTLSSRVGSKGYKTLMTIKYIPLKIENDVLIATPIIEKLRKLIIFS